jgi:hypothetical protein
LGEIIGVSPLVAQDDLKTAQWFQKKIAARTGSYFYVG